MAKHHAWEGTMRAAIGQITISDTNGETITLSGVEISTIYSAPEYYDYLTRLAAPYDDRRADRAAQQRKARRQRRRAKRGIR
jgi:hypothetical protein